MTHCVGALARTFLVVVGFVLLFAGIVTLAYPPLLPNAGAGDATGEIGVDRDVPTSAAGPTLFTSFVGIAWGLTIVAAGLAIPGRASGWIVSEPEFSRRQRTMVLLGSSFVVGLPAITVLAGTVGFQSLLLVVATVVLAPIGTILVTVGVASGLK